MIRIHNVNYLEDDTPRERKINKNKVMGHFSFEDPNNHNNQMTGSFVVEVPIDSPASEIRKKVLEKIKKIGEDKYE